LGGGGQTNGKTKTGRGFKKRVQEKGKGKKKVSTTLSRGQLSPTGGFQKDVGGKENFLQKEKQ